MCRRRRKQREGKQKREKGRGERNIKERGGFETLWLKDVIWNIEWSKSSRADAFQNRVNTLHSLWRACVSCRWESTLWLYRSSSWPESLYFNLAWIISHTKCEAIGSASKILNARFTPCSYILASECVCDVIHSFSYSAGGPGPVPALGGCRSVYFCRLAGTRDFLWVYCGWVDLQTA